MSEFRMPSLGSDMESGTLVEWLKHPGDSVRRGDIVAVVETQKGAIEVEIFVDGVMGAQLVALGATVPVGTPLAIVEDKGRTPPPVAKPAIPETVVAKPVAALKAPPMVGLRASPAARKLAAERGLDLATITGTGPDGAVTFSDVERAPSKPETKPAFRGLDLDKMREAIAAAMAHSKREIPHYYLATDIDMTRALAWLETALAPPNRGQYRPER